MASCSRSADLQKLFVYGTLKRGQPLHKELQEQMQQGKIFRFYGAGKTVDKWPFKVATEYNWPVILDPKGDGLRVNGEVYEVDLDTLYHFEKVERIGHYYQDKVIPVEISTTGEIVNAHGAVVQGFKPELLQTQCLENYDFYQHPIPNFEILTEDAWGQDIEELATKVFTQIWK